MCRLLLFSYFGVKRNFNFAVIFCCCLYLLFSGIYASVSERQRRGPNECSDDKANPCCLGWQIAPTSGLCLIAVCADGCGSGYCIGANLCRCDDGTLANSCGTSDGSLPPEYKYDRSVARGQLKDRDGGCESLTCQQKCHTIGGVAECYCNSGYTLDQDGTTCNDVDECEQYSHVCNHGCRNTVGGFKCICRRGYKLNNDGKTCIPVSEEKTPRKGLVKSQSYGRVEERQYIDDMLDPRVSVPSEQPPSLSTPQLAIKARVRIHRKHSSERLPYPPAVGSHLSTAEQYPIHPDVIYPTKPNIAQSRHPGNGQTTSEQHGESSAGQPRQPNLPHYNSHPGKIDPYNLPSQFNPHARYGQLPPELSKQVFGKYDRKKLVPFDFEDSEHDSQFDPSVLSPPDQGSRAIFWEEIPTDLTGVEYTHPCEGTDCPSFPDVYQTSVIEPTRPFTHRQTTNDKPLSGARRPSIRTRIQSKKSSKQNHRSKQRQRKTQGKQHKKAIATTVSKQDSTVSSTTQEPNVTSKDLNSPTMQTPMSEIQSPSSTTLAHMTTDQVISPTIPASITSKKLSTATKKTSTIERGGINKEELLQKDGRYCRGDLCYDPEDLQDLDLTTPPQIKIDEYGQCPGGFEKVTINDFEVCKPLPAESLESRPNVSSPSGNSVESLGTDHTETDIGNNNQIEATEEEENKIAANFPIKSTLPPFINYCVTEGKIMIITAQGILCRNKVEENIFVNCEEQEVYIETIAGYICRDPSIEDVLSTPIQCPLGHTLIATNTGYECRGTVVIESSCPDNYKTIQTMSGTICSPSAPLSPPERDVCGEGGSLMETENGIECKPSTDELTAPGTAVTNSLDTNLTQKVKCPPGQIAVQTNNGSQCKYYSRLQQGRGDLTPSCSTGQTFMDTKSGPICIGASISVEYDVPVTYDSFDSWTTGSPTRCPFGQQLVKTPSGEQCQGTTSLLFPTGDTVILQGSCRSGQIEVETLFGSECRWIGLKIIKESDFVCPSGSSLQQTNFGLLCINDTTSEPAVDFNTLCSEQQIALIAPRESVCRSAGVIGKILTVADIEQITSKSGCGQSLLEFQTISGALCLDKLTREPVIDEETICPQDEVSVLIPKGMACILKEDMLLYTTVGICSVGQSMMESSAWHFCVDRETKKPIINPNVVCPEGQSGFETPFGPYCLSNSDVQTLSLHEEKIDVETCDDSQSVLQTTVGAICIDRETLLPIIDDTLSCPDGQASVVTPAGSFCKLRSEILVRTSQQPDPKENIMIENECSEGQKIADTAVGAICIDLQTMLPIFDETVNCPNDQTAVVTPLGTLCKLRSAILTRVLKQPSSTGNVENEEVVEYDIPVTYDSIDSWTTGSPTRCPNGQRLVKTPYGEQCQGTKSLLLPTGDTIIKQGSCRPGQIEVETLFGSECRWIGLKIVKESDFVCPSGSSLQQTNFGLLCINDTTSEPAVDFNTLCSEQQIALIAPRESVCRSAGVIGKILTVADIEQITSKSGCGQSFLEFQTISGALCLDKLTREPVIDEETICPQDEVSVLIPKGMACILKEDMLLYTTVGICSVGQSMMETSAWYFCVDRETKEPIINPNVACPEGQSAFETPFGPYCLSNSDVQTLSLHEEKIDVETCDDSQSILQTTVGAICIDRETLLPIIDDTLSCPDGQASVVTPTGSFCKLRSEILVRTSQQPDPKENIMIENECSEGQKITDTAVGAICIDLQTMLPIFDETANCPDDQTAVVTPSGTLCKLRSAILTRVLKQPSSAGNVENEEVVERCRKSQSVLVTAAGTICIHSETLLPMIDETVSCSDGHAPIVTPRGTFCRLRSALLTPIPTGSEPVLSCDENQKVLETAAGQICVYNDTQLPIFDKTVSCPSREVSVLTPTGSFCKLKSGILVEINGSSSDLYCDPLQNVLQTSQGAICIHLNNSLPVTNETQLCAEDEIPVITPTGTDCKASSVIFAALSVDIDPTVHANKTPPCDAFRVYETAAGLICFHTYILLPTLDGTLKCEEGQVPAVTPFGSECKFRYDTLTFLKDGPVTINITASNITVSFTCGDGRSVQQLSIGVVCTDSKTLSPVVDPSMICPLKQVGVVTPAGTQCMKEADIFPKYSPAISGFPGPGRSICKDGQEVFLTKLGDICLYEESLLPVIDTKTACPDGEIPLVTPSGTLCAKRSFMLGVFSIQSNNQTCVNGRLTLRTKSGLICVSRENNQPVIHVDIMCETGMVSVQTPSGPLCMPRSILFGKFFKSFGDYTENLSTNLSLHICPEGQIFKDTDIGDLCLDNITMQPIIDEVVKCPEGELPVFTPGGVQCKSQSIILTMISKINIDEETVQYKSKLVCGKGFEIHGTTSGLICIDEHTKQPVVDDSMACLDGQIAVQSPTGTFCMLKSVVFARLSKITTITTPNPSSATILLKCESGQLEFKTDVGEICVFEETKTPVIDPQMVCPDGQSAVVSPSGTFCMLTIAIFARLSSIEKNMVNISAPATCLTLDTDVGPICVDKETQQPILDNSVSCEDNYVPVLSPFGTSCKLISAIMIRTGKKTITHVATFENKDVLPQVPGFCGANQTTYETDYDTICIYTETNLPVLNDTFVCENGHVAVVTPSGNICVLRSVLISKIINVERKAGNMTTSVTDIPSEEPFISTTVPGMSTNDPVMSTIVTGMTSDDSVMSTNVPTFLTDEPFFSSAVPGMASNDPVLSSTVPVSLVISEAGSTNKATASTEATVSVGSPGLDLSTENPEVSANVAYVSTTDVPFLSTVAPVDLTSIPDTSSSQSTTTETVTCDIGQKVLDTEFGPICIDIKTFKPILDPSVLCNENSQAVVTPNGPICFMNITNIFRKSEKIINETTVPNPCGSGLKVYKLKSSRICVDEETGQPVIKEEFYCPGMKIGVLTPNGVSCKSKKTILSDKFFGAIQAPVTPKSSGTQGGRNTEITRSNVIPLGCKTGQIVYQSRAGEICLYGDTLDPVINHSVFCMRGKVAVLTPSGTSCRLRDRILVEQEFTVTTMTPRGLTCRDGQFVGKSVSGLICIYEKTLEPVIHEEFNCPTDKIGVATPSGTVCFFKKDILDTPGNSIPASAKPICVRGQIPVLKGGKFICRHLVINKIDSGNGIVSTPSSITKQSSMCPPGQLVHATSAGDICVDDEQLQPVIDRSVSCPTGQISVMTPLGFACKVQIIIFRNIPKVTGSDLDKIRGCPPGHLVVVENEKLVCKAEDEVDDTECPPGYRKVYFEGVAGQPCEYIGFGKDKVNTKSMGENKKQKSYKCPQGQVLKQTRVGPKCIQVVTNSTTKIPLPSPERSYRPEIVHSKRKPCTPGLDCPDNERENSILKPPCIPGENCVGSESTYGPRIPCGRNCGERFNANIGMPGPCQKGINCVGSIPGAGIPQGANCLNGIQISNGQPCVSSGNIPRSGYVPCNLGGCGNAIPPMAPCQTGTCGHDAHGVPPQYGGCVRGGMNGNGCGGVFPNLYKYTVRQSCSSGFQPYQRGKVYMCIPVDLRGMCRDSMLLKSLLGNAGCSGIQQAVPPRQTLTPCSPSGRNPLTGKLNSGCAPVEGLQPIEDSSHICQEGEKLFLTSKGSTVCLQAASIGSPSVSNIQQEASPSCRADEDLVRTESGYVCQSRFDCNPPCANGGRCMDGVCRCPRGLTGNACQTDIDECKRLPARYCHYKCENSFGSFRCVCPDGYILNSDKKTCKGVSCNPGCRNGGSCSGGVCRCRPGFTGEYCQTDIDECSTNDGLCGYKCVNSPGSYTCVCPPGAKLREDKRTCEHISESCMVRCQNGASCKQHRCFCAPGFFGVSCQLDIDECYHFRPCNHVCHNTHGSYICGCRTGYTLASDGHMCLSPSPPDGSTSSRPRRRLISQQTRQKLS